MFKKITIITFLSTVFGLSLWGQTGRSLPFLELNGDTRTAGMGDANMGETQSAYLHTNPTAFFQNKDKVYASYTFGLYPKIDGNRQLFHAVSSGYKLFRNHSLMVGFRYLGGIKVPRMHENGIATNPIKPNDWSVDFAYAIRFTPHLSAYAGGSIIQSYIGRTAHTASFNAGVYYRGALSIIGEGGSYSVGLSINDLGKNIKFKNSESSKLPTSAGLGGSVSLPLHSNHTLNAALSTRYFMLPSDASEFTGGIGVEYVMYNIAAFRTGYHIGDSNGYLTLGVGGKFKFVNIDAAYTIANNSDFNLLRLGLSVQF